MSASPFATERALRARIISALSAADRIELESTANGASTNKLRSREPIRIVVRSKACESVAHWWAARLEAAYGTDFIGERQKERGRGSMTSEASVLPAATLGYTFNRGGLNNQKLALFGLFLRAFREGPRRIVLPDLILFDQVTFNHVRVPISDGFRLEELRAFAARNEIEILDHAPCGDRGAWDYFHYGNNYIPLAAINNELTTDSFICDFLRSLVPCVRDSEAFQRVRDAAFGDNGRQACRPVEDRA